jgi:ribosomal silencing factor RsfS
MSKPKEPMPAKLVVSAFLKEKALITSVVEDLMEKFGAVDVMSAWMPFDWTSYYQAEMGTPLYRRMIVFKQLIEQQALSEIKQITNDIEKRYVENDKRRVNIDPGYLLLERFVLATGKNFSHRIYIGKQIYADLTLIYKKGGFQALPWTFPDYADSGMHVFLEKAREKYAFDLKQEPLYHESTKGRKHEKNQN